MGSYLFTISHTSLTMPPSLTRLLSYISASSSPSVSLLSLFLYSPPPTIPSSLLPSLTLPFSLVLLPSCCGKHVRTDILIISVHIPHLIYLFLLFPFPLPLCGLHFFFSLRFCLPPLLLCLSACWRLECEFPPFKVLGWAVS